MPHSATNPAPNIFDPGHLGELTRIIPPEMIDAALDTGGGREQRLRRLPSRVIVYLLLAGALFAGQGWLHVWARLTAGLSLPPTRPARSSLTGAMRRVGPRPLRELFTLLAGPAVTNARHTGRFAGRLVVAIDGTQIAIPDSEMNRMRFPKHTSGPNGEAGYPMLRLVTIIATGTRQIIDAVFGSDRIGELAYASQLIGCLRPNMLLLADRSFATYRFFAQLADTGAQFLIRGKTGRGAMTLPTLARLPDGSYLSHAAGLPVRVITARITITTPVGTRTSDYRFITTLLDPSEASAEQLVRLYHERWEIETAYCELKSVLQNGHVLRGKHPAAVAQELWAILSVYQALRTAMTDAILHRPDIDPDRLSFTSALYTAREQLLKIPHTDLVIDLVGHIGEAILANLLPGKQVRTRPRVVKRAISKHRAKGRNLDRRTYPATLHTTIHTSDPDP